MKSTTKTRKLGFLASKTQATVPNMHIKEGLENQYPFLNSDNSDSPSHICETPALCPMAATGGNRRSAPAGYFLNLHSLLTAYYLFFIVGKIQ